MKAVDLIIFMNFEAGNYRLAGQLSAERICRATLKRVITFIGRATMSFKEQGGSELPFSK